MVGLSDAPRSAYRHGVRRRALALALPSLLMAVSWPTAIVAQTIPYVDLPGDECFLFSQMLQYKQVGDQQVELPFRIVINDDASYRNLFRPDLLRESCKGRDPATIISDVDFSQRTVLGRWASGSCAATGFKRSVTRDDGRKAITYAVSVEGSALSCSGPGLESLNLISIPKLPAGYRILFR